MHHNNMEEVKITLFELLISSGGAIAAIVGAWIHMRISVAKLNTELSYLSRDVEEEKDGNKDVVKKMDKVFGILTAIKEDIATLKAR